MNRVKEAYILSAISIERYSGADSIYDGKEIKSAFNIHDDEYAQAVDILLEKKVLIHGSKFDIEEDGSVDEYSINQENFDAFLEQLKKQLGYKDQVDLRTLSKLAGEIRVAYPEQQFIEAIKNEYSGVYKRIKFEYSVEQTLFHLLSSRNDKNIFNIDCLEALARIFDYKYYSPKKLMEKAVNFFDVIDELMGELLSQTEHDHWRKNLPRYIRERLGQNHTRIEYYITKYKGTFYYNGARVVTENTASDGYIIFSCLFNLLPYGGVVSYKDLGVMVKKLIPKARNLKQREVNKLIQRNLTEGSNSFFHSIRVPNITKNKEELVAVIRGQGIIFRNAVI